MNNYLLEVSSLSKSFGGIKALSNVNFQLEAGSVHALCGGNGAGKSTFLSIVMGIQKRDGGEIKINGKPVNFSSPAEALQSGISIIEQELSPVPAMTVAENIYLGREPVNKFGCINFKKMNHSAQELLDKLNFKISAKDIMFNLSIAQLQLVEIAKAISYNSNIIIMDEPTSALGENEAKQLFSAIKTLKEQKKGIIYVSHRITELFDISDTYSIFRDGQFIESGKMRSIDRQSLIQLIVGRPLSEEYVKDNQLQEENAFEVKNMDINESVRDISFVVKKSEILAFYGLLGAGRKQIFQSIFGLNKFVKGEIYIDGKNTSITSPIDAIKQGLALITDDRKGSGLVLSQDVRSNICLSSIKQISAGPFVLSSKEIELSLSMIKLFNIKTATDKINISNLSGGNQQKVVLGKWFLMNPKILLLHEPTRGVDIGAKREIYKIMSDFASKGGAVILISSEIDEVLGMADNVIVIKNGKISKKLTREELKAETLVHYAA